MSAGTKRNDYIWKERPPKAFPSEGKAFGRLRFQYAQAAAIPLIRLAIRSTPCPQFGIVVFEQSIAQILVASLSQPPRASALRQARVSGGNLQNCAPSAACGGAYAPALFCHRQGRYSGSRLGKGFNSCTVVKQRRHFTASAHYAEGFSLGRSWRMK